MATAPDFFRGAKCSGHRLLLGFHTFGQSYMHVPEMLGRAGFPVDAVLTPKHSLRRVLGISRTFLASPDEWASAVEKRLLSGEYSLFLNVDEQGLKALYDYSWHPDAVRFLPLDPASETAATVGSKREFYDWCLRNRLPAPETHFCESFPEAWAMRQRLPGPWFLKGDAGSGGQSVHRGGRGSEPSGEIPPGTWLVQRDEGTNVGSGIFLADHGRLVSWMGIRKVVCLNQGLGPTVLGRGDPGEDVGELCRRVAMASGVTGLTGFDFVRTPDRGLLLIDSHLGRMSPMQHFDRLYRVDFAAGLRACLLDKTPGEPAPPHPGPAFIKFPEVLQLIMQGGLGNLLKEVDLQAKIPLAPPGDPLTGIRSACSTVVSQARVNAGRWRRRVFSGR
jgi:hypothetical protein